MKEETGDDLYLLTSICGPGQKFSLWFNQFSFRVWEIIFTSSGTCPSTGKLLKYLFWTWKCAAWTYLTVTYCSVCTAHFITPTYKLKGGNTVPANFLKHFVNSMKIFYNVVWSFPLPRPPSSSHSYPLPPCLLIFRLALFKNPSW